MKSRQIIRPCGRPLSHPMPAIEFVLGFLGNPFTFGTNLPPLPLGMVMGGLLVAVLLICAVYLWNKRTDRNLLAEGLPWLVLAMVAVSSAVLTMIGRLGFGPAQVRASRYITFAVMLPIALLAPRPDGSLALDSLILRTRPTDDEGRVLSIV